MLPSSAIVNDHPRIHDLPTELVDEIVQDLTDISIRCKDLAPLLGVSRMFRDAVKRQIFETIDVTCLQSCPINAECVLIHDILRGDPSILDYVRTIIINFNPQPQPGRHVNNSNHLNSQDFIQVLHLLATSRANELKLAGVECPWVDVSCFEPEGIEALIALRCNINLRALSVSGLIGIAGIVYPNTPFKDQVTTLEVATVACVPDADSNPEEFGPIARKVLSNPTALSFQNVKVLVLPVLMGFNLNLCFTIDKDSCLDPGVTLPSLEVLVIGTLDELDLTHGFGPMASILSRAPALRVLELVQRGELSRPTFLDPPHTALYAATQDLYLRYARRPLELRIFNSFRRPARPIIGVARLLDVNLPLTNLGSLFITHQYFDFPWWNPLPMNTFSAGWSDLCNVLRQAPNLRKLVISLWFPVLHDCSPDPSKYLDIQRWQGVSSFDCRFFNAGPSIAAESQQVIRKWTQDVQDVFSPLCQKGVEVVVKGEVFDNRYDVHYCPYTPESAISTVDLVPRFFRDKPLMLQGLSFTGNI